VRLFVALELPAEVRAALPAPAEPWRPVRPDGLHVTLAFLGSLPSPEPVVAALPPSLPPAGPLRTVGAVALPRRRPRVLAVELEDVTGRCGAVQAAVAGALRAAGLYAADHPRWLAHVTIGRAPSRPGRVGRDEPLPAVEPLEFVPEAVTLYASHLGHGPARYEALRAWPLAPS
jgi:RNA 2',3'-cyclic 3'-phosphodiesterase